MTGNESLLALARAARARAYAPYSNFAVGAALLTEEGAVFTGSNLENASFGLTVCAERVAIWSAVHAGCRRFRRIAVAADCSPPPAPCGACRQVMWEYAREITVVAGNLQGEVIERSLAELLPEAFGGGEPPRFESGLTEETWRLPVTFRPVGYVASRYREPRAIPANYRELLSQIMIDPEMEEGLYRLEEEEKLIVIGYLHRARGFTLKEKRSGRGGEVYGIFACRAPLRPNGISHTVVDLVERRGRVLTVRGLDLIDGTPVLDLKTVISENR